MNSETTWGFTTDEWTALSAIGSFSAALLTFAAVSLSLYLATQDRPKLSIATRLLTREGMPEEGDPSQDRRYVQVLLTNKGKVPLIIQGFFWQIGIWPWRKVTILPPFQTSLNQHNLPYELAYGQQIAFFLPLFRLEMHALEVGVDLSRMASYRNHGVPLCLKFGVVTTIKSFTKSSGEVMSSLFKRSFDVAVKMAEK